MNRDQLYLLKPNFQERGKTYYCPSCAEVLGLLEFYPALKPNVERLRSIPPGLWFLIRRGLVPLLSL